MSLCLDVFVPLCVSVCVYRVHVSLCVCVSVHVSVV